MNIKKYIMLSPIVFLISCTTTQVKNKIMTVDRDQNIKVSIEQASYQTPSQLKKYTDAIILIKKILNSDILKSEILTGPEKQQYVVTENEDETTNCGAGNRSTYSFNTVNEKCYNNKEIYKKIQAADWKFNVKVNSRPWALWCGWPWINEVGHRKGNLIITQECWLNKMTKKELAGHLIHEYLHIIGFGHPYEKKYAKKRMTTIPYYIGDKASGLLNKI